MHFRYDLNTVLYYTNALREKKNNIGSFVGLLDSVLISNWLKTNLSEEIVNLFCILWLSHSDMRTAVFYIHATLHIWILIVINIALSDVTEALVPERAPFLFAKTSVILALIEAEETLVCIPVSFISCL